MANAKPKTLRLTHSLLALAAGLLAAACLAGCARDATIDAPMPEMSAAQDHGQSSKAQLCLETATDVPAIAEWAPIDFTPGESLPGSLIQALEQFLFTRKVLGLADLPLQLDDFESMEMGDYQDSLTYNVSNFGEEFSLKLHSADGISGVPGSRNAVVHVWHLRAADHPDSWYVFDWRYELPCPPGES